MSRLVPLNARKRFCAANHEHADHLNVIGGKTTVNIFHKRLAPGTWGAPLNTDAALVTVRSNLAYTGRSDVVGPGRQVVVARSSEVQGAVFGG